MTTQVVSGSNPGELADESRNTFVYEDFEVSLYQRDWVVVRSLGAHLQRKLTREEQEQLEELEKLVTAKWLWWPGSRHVAPTSEPKIRTTNSEYQKVGRQLFDALFSGEIRDLFYESLGRTSTKQVGLRIRICFDPKESESLRMASLPWELMRDDKGFFALRRETPIIRAPLESQSVEEKPTVQQLNVLAVMAMPKDQASLQLQQEWKAIDGIWKNHPTVKVKKLENPDFEEFCDELDDRSYHVLHFMGHGGFRPDENEWVLCFTSKEGETEEVHASLLWEQTFNFRNILRLVVLNACHTARICEHDPEEQDESSKEAGIAGIAVVAMQAEISDYAAIVFSRTLYHRLASGDPLERAVSVGRERILLNERKGVVPKGEWALPVLYMRTSHGELFDVAAKNAYKPEPKRWWLADMAHYWLKRPWLNLAILILVVFTFLIIGENYLGRSDPKVTHVEIGNNRFPKEKVIINIGKNDFQKISGNAIFDNSASANDCHCRWSMLIEGRLQEVASTAEACGFSIEPIPKEDFQLRLIVDDRTPELIYVYVQENHHP
jgi:hypothetical protein